MSAETYDEESFRGLNIDFRVMLTASDIHEFWFGSDLDDPESIASQCEMWFQSKTHHDELITRKFETQVELALKTQLKEMEESPKSLLSLILLLDQFPRNIYRGTPKAFQGDSLALGYSLDLIEKGLDTQFHPLEKTFIYLPLEHAEDLNIQRVSVEKFTELEKLKPQLHEELFSEFLRYAILHMKIVEKFGRFPHRNMILGRESTSDELQFLASGGPDFGQG